MTLVFNDESTIEVNNIIGGPQLLYGSMRDVLTIELDSSNNIYDLKEIFSDQNKIKMIYSLNGDEKSPIAEGYLILVSVAEQLKEVRSKPGTLNPVIMRCLCVVQLAQITYCENILMQNGVSLESLFLTEA